MVCVQGSAANFTTRFLKPKKRMSRKNVALAITESSSAAMTQHWTFYILLSTFLLNSPSDGAEDLLDQYVKHVENVNRITLEPHVNLGHKKGTPLRTSYYRRSLKSVQDSEERTNEQDMPTALKSNETDSAVLAREHKDDVEEQYPKNKTHQHNNGHTKGSTEELEHSSVLVNKHEGGHGRKGMHKHKHGSRKGFKQKSEASNVRSETNITNSNEARTTLAQKASHKRRKGKNRKRKAKPGHLSKTNLV
nr:unnamed protein product [Callosobruchus analis]